MAASTGVPRTMRPHSHATTLPTQASSTASGTGPAMIVAMAMAARTTPDTMRGPRSAPTRAPKLLDLDDLSVDGLAAGVCPMAAGPRDAASGPGGLLISRCFAFRAATGAVARAGHVWCAAARYADDRTKPPNRRSRFRYSCRDRSRCCRSKSGHNTSRNKNSA
jgi:hypothetical protein